MANISDKIIGNSNFYTNKKIGKALILDYVLRNASLFKKNSEKVIDSFLKETIKEIYEEFLIPPSVLSYFLEHFLFELKIFRKFLKNCKISWYTKDSKKRYRYVKLYVHKIHRLAPIFNYKRARINLENLHKLFNLKNFWPHLTTQLALVIFITEKMSNEGKEIQQKNIRALCNCSAYAFHRTRNKLELEKYLQK